MERLSGDYIKGYTKAIMDLQEVFRYIQPDLKYHKLSMTPKRADEILSCCLKNREDLRENRQGFVRYNDKIKGFEFFIPERR